ncbi:hypothetical protein EYR36_006129 [Pleurotus pulmonarius]|nr:hypothetical protein EYR36_006129 [Pleurotus pulmonarius]
MKKLRVRSRQRVGPTFAAATPRRRALTALDNGLPVLETRCGPLFTIVDPDITAETSVEVLYNSYRASECSVCVPPRSIATKVVAYTAPPRKQPFLDRIPHDYIIYGILAANGIVFGMWFLADIDYKSGDPSSLLWMRNNFTMSMRNVTNSRPWVLVTSIFSHFGMGHILFNCFAFYCMAPPVLGMLGGRSFLTLYFAGGIFASLVSSTYNKIFKGRDMESVGASAAIYSTVAYLACAAPRTTFYLYAIVPLPAWLFVPAILGFDMWSWVSNRVRFVLLSDIASPVYSPRFRKQPQTLLDMLAVSWLAQDTSWVADLASSDFKRPHCSVSIHPNIQANPPSATPKTNPISTCFEVISILRIDIHCKGAQS